MVTCSTGLSLFELYILRVPKQNKIKEKKTNRQNPTCSLL